MLRVVFDTNVFVSALRSNNGASFQLFRLLGTSLFEPAVSTPLCLEYEEVLLRPGLIPEFNKSEITSILDSFIRQSHLTDISYLWRPFLADADDDLVLEAALASSSQCIITHNTKDFAGVESLGIMVLTPNDFLSYLRNL